MYPGVDLGAGEKERGTLGTLLSSPANRLEIVIMVPVVLGLLPGMELTLTTAMVPILDVSLATKDVIAGTINPLHLVITYVSLFLLAAASMVFAVTWFNREEALFRT